MRDCGTRSDCGRRLLAIAACAPSSCGFAPPSESRLVEMVSKGRECDPVGVLRHVDILIEHQIGILERAAGAEVQVAVIPEDATRLGEYIRKRRCRPSCADVVGKAYERFIARIGALCRRRGIFVVGGVATTRGGRFYNTAVMLDPTGRVVASYDKTHLPRAGEHKTYDAGETLGVFDTAIGRVGFLICWDILFPEAFGELALAGAEIVFQPTFGHWEEWNDAMARVRAMDWSVPLVVSMWGGCACIIDAEGTIVARTGHAPDSLAVATLDLAKARKFQYFKIDARLEKMGERRPEIYRHLAASGCRTRQRGETGAGILEEIALELSRRGVGAKAGRSARG